jgi:hypothetical protein
MKCIECKNYMVAQHNQTNSIDKICASNKKDLRLIFNLKPENCKNYKDAKAKIIIQIKTL